MKICQQHWDMIRQSVIVHGMDHLGAKSGQQAIADTIKDLEGVSTKDDFDPNMSHHWHWMHVALTNGGLYLLNNNEDGSNEGNYCPICEFVYHYNTFDAQKEIDTVSAAMRDHCKQNGLI